MKVDEIALEKIVAPKLPIQPLSYRVDINVLQEQKFYNYFGILRFIMIGILFIENYILCSHSLFDFFMKNIYVIK